MDKESNYTAWRIRNNEAGELIREVIHDDHPVTLDLSAYNYKIYTPLILAPISKSITLVLSEYCINSGDPTDIGLRLHDLRLVETSIVSSVVFTLRGSQSQLKKLKYDMLKAADNERCVGISFLLRKIYYSGFNTIYAPKKLKKRESDTLRNAFNFLHQSTQSERTDNVG